MVTNQPIINRYVPTGYSLDQRESAITWLGRVQRSICMMNTEKNHVNGSWPYLTTVMTQAATHRQGYVLSGKAHTKICQFELERTILMQ
jgi:hypothetical protein